ncbi:MAG: PH domain-containing protein [Phycisphaerales bacterium]|nr:PH domain-containing protein [Phycisphaerales bacterium]
MSGPRLGPGEPPAWVKALYGRMWEAIERWLRAPKTPPHLPTFAGGHVRALKPSDGWMRYVKMWFWIALLISDAVFAFLWLATLFVSPLLFIALAPIALAVIVLPDVVAYVGIHLRYDSTWYVLSDRAMRIRRGVWVIRETTITYENVQNVHVSSGPIQRLFGFSTLVVQTAGGGGAMGPHGQSVSAGHSGVLEGIGEAEALRDEILSRVRASRSAGLGDEHHPVPQPGGGLAGAGPGWSPAVLGALRGVRDEAAALRATMG